MRCRLDIHYDINSPDFHSNHSPKGGSIMNLRNLIAVTAMGTLFAQGCVTKPEKTIIRIGHGIIATGTSFDYSEGNMGAYDIETGKSYRNFLTIFDDNSVRYYNGSAYVIERGAFCNITKLDTSALNTVVRQEIIGTAVNPHDIAFISDTKAYITCYDADAIRIYNPSTGMMTGQSIDLSSYTAAGGLHPGMDAAVAYNGKAYVGLQKLAQDYSPTENSSILSINGANDTREEEILLKKTNPQGMSLSGSKLYIACTAAYTQNTAIALDGDIEVIDLAGARTADSIVDESMLNGNVSDVLVINDSTGYAIVSDAGYNNHLIQINPREKTVGAEITAVGAASQVVFDDPYLYAADRTTTAPGIVVIDPATGQKVGATINVGLPPNRLAVIR
jgi:DNA-binding beta-propeller fold protein YncE